MEIRPKVTHKGNTLVFASPDDGHLYTDDGKQIEEFTDGNGFKRVFIDGLNYNVSFLNAKTFFPNDIQIMVGHKDGNRANNKKDNLFWYGSGELKEINKNRVRNKIKGNSKIVVKNATTGEIIAEFKKTQEVADFLGIRKTAVSGRLHHKIIMDNIIITRVPIEEDIYEEATLVEACTPDEGGYEPSMIIDNETPTTEEPQTIEKEEEKDYNQSMKKTNPNKKKVYQLDPDTLEVIKEHDSIREAAESLNIESRDAYSFISRCASGKAGNSKAYGYRWAFSLDGLAMNDIKESKTKKKKVYGYDPDTLELIEMFGGLREAAKAKGLAHTSLAKFIKDGREVNGILYSYEGPEPLTGKEREDHTKMIEGITKESDFNSLFDDEDNDNKDIQMKEEQRTIDNRIEMIDGDEVLATYKDITTLARVLNLSHRETAEHIVKGERINGYTFKWIG